MGKWTKKNLRINRDFEISCVGEWILVNIQTWFNVEREYDDWWINLYARYNPFTGELRISRPDGKELHDYHPSKEDEALVVKMIEEAVREHIRCSPYYFINLKSEDKSLNGNQFYDYIVNNFSLNGTACRLVKNIIDYVEAQGFVEQKDSHRHLSELLEGAFGIEKCEIKRVQFD